jgi:hypothetical protein
MVSGSYKKRFNNLIQHYVDFDLSLRIEEHLRRGILVDSRRNTPMVDFGVERHTLVTRGHHTDLPSIFNNSFIGCNNKGTHIHSEGTNSEEVQWIDLSLLGRGSEIPL